MHIGLIGGIGPASTDVYYRGLVAAFAAQERDLEMTVAHADAPTLVHHLMTGQVARQVEIYVGLAERLKRAGADGVAVTSLGGHFCIREFAEVSPLPVLDMVADVAAHVASKGYKRLGILGTKPVMASGLYGGLPDVSLFAPSDAAIDGVHDAYITMAGRMRATDVERRVFAEASDVMMSEQKAEAIVLGGTDLALVYDEASAPFPIVDCAGIHIDAIAQWAGG